LDYWTVNSTDTDHEIWMTLTLSDESYASWGTDGNRGAYWGVTFGNQMDDVDCILCQVSWRGPSSNNNVITCNDYWSETEALPPLDSQQDVTTNSTAFSSDTVARTVFLSATFHRKFDTGDSDKDTALGGGEQELSYAHGQLFNGVKTAHSASDSGDGFMIDIL